MSDDRYRELFRGGLAPLVEEASSGPEWDDLITGVASVGVTRPPSRAPGWVITLGVAAVVLLVFGLAVFLAPSSPPSSTGPVGTTPESSVEFDGAAAAHDVETWWSLVISGDLTQASEMAHPDAQFNFDALRELVAALGANLDVTATHSVFGTHLQPELCYTLTGTSGVETGGAVFRQSGQSWLLWEIRPNTVGCLTSSTTSSAAPLPIDIVDLAGIRTPIPADLAVSADWTELDPGPLDPRWAAATFWTGDEIVIWGGEAVGGVPAVTGGAAYNPASATWRTVADSPLDNQADVSWVWTGDEFVVWNRQEAAAWIPTDNTWRTINDWPLTSTLIDTAAWTGDAIIDAASGLVEVSDGTLTAVADPPSLHERASVVWVNGRLVSVTGEGSYDPTTDSWTPMPPSALTPLATAGAAIGDTLVAVDYEMNAAEYNPSDNTWTPLPDLPLRFSECAPRIHEFRGSALVDHCSGLAFWAPTTSSWIPVPHPEPAPANLQAAVIPADDRLFVWGDGFYEFIGDAQQPERLALGTSILDVPENWTIVSVIGDAPVEATIESAGGDRCTASAYNSDAETILRTFLTDTTTVTQVQPVIGNQRDTLEVEAGIIDDQHHLVWPVQTTDVIDVACTSESAAQDIAKQIWMPYQ